VLRARKREDQPSPGGMGSTPGAPRTQTS
jgi:hypothetical protein